MRSNYNYYEDQDKVYKNKYKLSNIRTANGSLLVEFKNRIEVVRYCFSKTAAMEFIKNLEKDFGKLTYTLEDGYEFTWRDKGEWWARKAPQETETGIDRWFNDSYEIPYVLRMSKGSLYRDDYRTRCNF